MTQEEKAKAYSKAVEKAKHEYSITTSEDRKQWLEELFPELKESDDERIRKEILDYIDKSTGCKRWVAWLEKQGELVEINPSEFDSQLNKLLKQFETLPKEELINSLNFYLNVVQNNGTYKEKKQCEKPQGKSAVDAINEEKVDNQNCVKPSIKDEPKFKIGDWCIDNEDGTIFQIVKVLDKTYRYRTNEGKEYSCSHYSLELDARLWTISDAKGGDILVDEDDNIGIYYRKVDDVDWHSYVYLGRDIYFRGGGYHIIKNTKPATKEQCDTLMKAMADAGYTFDFEKKVLKNIDKKPEETSISLKDFQEAFELKARQYDIELPNRGYDIHAMCKELYSMLTEQKPTWSQEDKHWMQKVIDFMNHPDLIKATPTLAKDTINWLKSFEERVIPNQKQEWSEDDESNFQMLIDLIKENKHHATDYEHMKYYKLLSWFKSLKDRYVWKPSDEQIDALEHFVRSIGESGFASPYDDNMKLLYSLLEQLKKLKG